MRYRLPAFFAVAAALPTFDISYAASRCRTAKVWGFCISTNNNDMMSDTLALQ